MSQLYLTGAALAKKPTITVVQTGYNATDTVNDNFTNLRNAFDNTLSLDGSTPNAMNADLDLNGNSLLNVGTLYVDNIIYGNEPLPVEDGGTGASTASGARTNLGLGTMATQTASDYLTTSTASSTYLTQANASSTYLTQSNAASTYQPLDSDLTALGGLSKTDGNFIVGDGSTWTVESGSTARASLGLGTAATEASTAFAAASHTHTASAVTDFSEAVDDRVSNLLVAGSGITLTYNDLGNSLTIAASSSGTGDVTGPASATANNFASFDGTTGKAIKDSTYSASSFAAAVHTHTISDVTNLQTTLDGKQSLDADLTAIAALANTDGNFIVGNGTTWVAESGATARTSLGLGTMATETASNYLTTATAASTYQPLDSDLTTIAGLAKTDGNFIVGNGTNWVVESNSTARASLGLGTIATQAASNVSITGGSATGLSSVTTTGDVGVYTATPEYRLDVTAADNVTTTTAVSIQNSSRNYGLGLGAYQLTNRNIGGTATTVDYTFDIGGAAIFKTANTERMKIDSSGYVAINTTPQSYAQLRMQNDRAATAYAYVNDTYNGATFENSYVQGFDGSKTFLGNYQNFALTFLTNNTEKVRITTAGRLGVGTISPTCLLDVSGGISTASTAVTSPAATDGNIFSGTYTPTLTNVTNAAASTAYLCQYMRVGNVVTVSGRVAIDPTTVSLLTEIRMTLPISATINAQQRIGGTFARGGTGTGNCGSINGDTATNTALFAITPSSAANADYFFSFTYGGL